jgi:hypothetical protein
VSWRSDRHAPNGYFNGQLRIQKHTGCRGGRTAMHGGRTAVHIRNTPRRAPAGCHGGRTAMHCGRTAVHPRDRHPLDVMAVGPPCMAVGPPCIPEAGVLWWIPRSDRHAGRSDRQGIQNSEFCEDDFCGKTNFDFNKILR